MHKSFLVLCIAALLTGCLATPYQPFEVLGRGGYTDKRLGPDTWQVTIHANQNTGEPAMATMFLVRSAELALANGFDCFEPLEGYARMASGAFAGFRTLERRVRMCKGEAPPRGHAARKVIEQFGPAVKAIK